MVLEYKSEWFFAKKIYRLQTKLLQKVLGLIRFSESNVNSQLLDYNFVGGGLSQIGGKLNDVRKIKKLHIKSSKKTFYKKRVKKRHG